jgi:hypothetical protein
VNDFTFYGDLVAISSIYAAAPQTAYKHLNTFYNEVFFGLEGFYKDHADREIEMFSDSLVVKGPDFHDFVTVIAPIYMNLLAKGLMLRGALVRGRLKYDVRLEKVNFSKRLPDSDVLARAVALERKVKGARFVVEREIAELYLHGYPEWHTLHGYCTNRRLGQHDLSIQRALVPLPDGGAYEFLYPVIADQDKATLESRMSESDYIASALPAEFSVHYVETKRMLKHSLERLNDSRRNV